MHTESDSLCAICNSGQPNLNVIKQKPAAHNGVVTKGKNQRKLLLETVSVDIQMNFRNQSLTNNYEHFLKVTGVEQ